MWRRGRGRVFHSGNYPDPDDPDPGPGSHYAHSVSGDPH